VKELVAIAKVAKPRGIKGEVSATLLTDFPKRFEGLENVTAVLPDHGLRELKIENAFFQNERIVLKFEGVNSIEAAEELRGAEVCVDEVEAVELEEDEYYDWQLNGCEVVGTDDKTIGHVRELMRTGGTENLIVESEGREMLIPFAKAICVEVDIENKRIVVDLPEGLLEL
jgi:16S rRNA processing protein RimM